MARFYQQDRRRSEDLARVHDPERVEDRLHRPLSRHLGLAQLEGKPPGLERAHAVLAGDRAAHAERLAYQPLERRLRPSPAVRVVQGEEEARVQVAVATVPGQRDVDAVLGAEAVPGPDEV